MRSGLCAVLLLLSSPLLAAPACIGDSLLVEMRLTSPLRAAEPDSSQVVALYANGCVHARYPQFDRRHGNYAQQLSKAQLDHIASEVDASGVAAIDASLLRKRLDDAYRSKAANSGAVLYMVTDEDIVELQFSTNEKSGSGRPQQWRSLQRDLLNHPEDPDLLRISALIQRLSELGQAVQQENSGAQP